MSKPLIVAVSIAFLGCAGHASTAEQPAPNACGGLADPAWAEVKDPDKTIAACTRVIQGLGTSRERAVASVNRAIAYWAKAKRDKSGDALAGHDAAAADLEEAVRLDPKFAYVHYARGVSLSQTYDTTGADLAEFDEAIRLDPNYALAYQGRAKVLRLMRGDNDRAKADYDTAIRLDPELAPSYIGRGQIRMNAGDSEAAIADFSEALRLSAAVPEARGQALWSRAFPLYTKGDAERALADLDEAIEFSPPVSGKFTIRGVVRLTSGALDLARADFKRATELEPKDAEAAVWREIADRRVHAKGRLAEAADKFDMSAWPAAVVRAMIGEPSPLTLLEAANDDKAWRKRTQTCQAYLFTGELALIKEAKSEAAEAFRSAGANCFKNGFEHAAAAAELKALGGKL